MPAFSWTTTCLSKYISRAGRKKIPLHRKHGDKNWYKGTGSAKTGHLNSLGRFKADPELLPNIVVPDLSGFKLKPYVAKSLHKTALKETGKTIFGPPPGIPGTIKGS